MKTNKIISGLRRTGATRLFQCGNSESMIKTVTGHASLEALREYIVPSTRMLKDISKNLNCDDTSSNLASMSSFNHPSINLSADSSGCNYASSNSSMNLSADSSVCDKKRPYSSIRIDKKKKKKFHFSFSFGSDTDSD